MEMTTPSEQVAGNVRSELARHRRSQGDLAQALSRSQPYVSRRLNGRVAFDVNEVHAIAVYLGVPVDVLLDSVSPADVA